MNAFESGSRKVIPAVLIYVRHGRNVLMIHRGKAGDFHQGKWNGLGGKLELDESPLEGARRELREESGLDLPESAFRALGVLQFPNFKPHKQEDWICTVFTVRIDAGLPAPKLARCEEGELHWVDEDQVAGLNLWPGDRHFIADVVAETPFIATIWYEGPDVKRYWVSRF